MKISFVTSNLAPFRIDWLDELAKYIDVTIFYNEKVETSDNEYVNPEYLARRPLLAKYKNIMKSLFGKFNFYNYKKILDNRADIIILDGYGFKSQVLLVFLLKLLKKPFILSVDGGMAKHQERVFNYKIKKMIISSASYLFSTCDKTDEYLIHYGANKDKIYRHRLTSLLKSDILKYPTTDKEKSDIRVKLNIPDKFTIIAVGKFIPRKGFDILIDSIACLKNDISVLLIGGEPPEEYKSAENDKVKYIGFCDKMLLNEYYKASDIFVLPTRYDVWGLVINEAMAKGLPIITTDKCVAGVTLIKNSENGFIIPIDDKISLAKYIDQLAANKDLCKKMSENNLEEILSYSIEEIVKQDLINLNDILNINKSI